MCLFRYISDLDDDYFLFVLVLPVSRFDYCDDYRYRHGAAMNNLLFRCGYSIDKSVNGGWSQYNWHHQVYLKSEYHSDTGVSSYEMK